MEKIICVFGDSITWGAWDKEHGGWVERLKTYFWSADASLEETAWVHNLGVSANTTKQLLERFDEEVRRRTWTSSESHQYKENNIIIFQIGKNDSIYVKTNATPWVTAPAYRENLLTLIEKARALSNHIIFLGLAHVDETKTTPINENEEFYDNENIEAYDTVVREVCHENNAHYIPIVNVIGVEDLDDGLHPNAHGHQKIFETVRAFLLENNIV